MASRAILSNVFKEQRTQNHPQNLSRLSRAFFPTTFLEIAVYAKCMQNMRKDENEKMKKWAKQTDR